MPTPSTYTKRQAKTDLDVLLQDGLIELSETREALGLRNRIIQRSMSVMMAYAIWEGFFRQGNGICLRLVRTRFRNAKDCPNKLASLWFRKSGDYESLVKFINNHKLWVGEGKEAKGPYSASNRFLDVAKQWSASAIDPSIDVNELIVTFSNVDVKVLRFNAEIFDIGGPKHVGAMDVSMLNELVGKRNDVAHGNSPSFGKKETTSLLDYTKKLLSEYHDVLRRWIISFKMR